MYVLQLIYRLLSNLVSHAVLPFLLACVALDQNAALAQQRILSSEPQSYRLNLGFSGDQSRPLAMVSGDFDEDGIEDLIIGYGQDAGGSIAVLRGNPDVIAPRMSAGLLAPGRHESSDSFLLVRKRILLNTLPSEMVAADVNGDGHLDLVYASRGSSSLQVMFGTGKGTFLPQSASITLPGVITALAAYRPGAPVAGEALIVGYESRQGASLEIVSYGATGLSRNAVYSLPSPATMLTAANLDADFIPDTAIVAGGELLVLHGKDAIEGTGRLEALPLNDVESVASGEFLFDRHAQLQLSAVTSRGEVIVLAHQGFDPRPYTPQEIAAARREQLLHPGSPSLAQLAGNTGNEPWVEIETHAGLLEHTLGSEPPILLSSRLNGSGADDLVVLNSSQQQRLVIGHSIAPSSSFVLPARSRIAFNTLASGSLVAALSLRVSSDGRPGLVLLHGSDVSPEIVLPSSANTFYVTTNADNTGNTTDPSDGIRCTLGSSETCTLRDAITFANNDAADNISAGKSDTIMVPSGSYKLTWKVGSLDANGNALTHLEILGPVTIIGDTSGAGVIIDAASNDTVFTINPGPYGSSNSGGNSYVFDATLENLTIENGKNNNNPNTNNSGLTNNVGGCINWDAFGAGNLTLSNSSVQHCTVLWGPGGGIWAENSVGGVGTLTLSGGSVSNNSTPEQGGAVYIAFPPVALSSTNTVFAANLAQGSVNSGDPGADGVAGGLYLTARQSTSTPQSTLSGITVSQNVADEDGGGIYSTTGIVLGTSLFTNNSSGRWGGGIFSEVASPEVSSTITSTNFLKNSATVAGGAILVGPDTQAAGNALQITLSRIFGNTSAGASGLAVGDPGGANAGGVVAKENWWGCNAGPTTAGDGCDQAVLYNSTTGSLLVAPYAQFGLAATGPTPILLGNSIGLAITLDQDSAKNPIPGAFPAVAAIYPYTFSVTGVTTNPVLTTGTFSTTGAGAATLTPSSAGNGTVSATFDNQTDTLNFSVQGAASTSLQIAVAPASTFPYGQPPTLITVQLNPSSAANITRSDFQVLVDGSPSLAAVPFTLTPMANNLFAISGPFNLLAPGGHTLKVNFLGTPALAASTTSAALTVTPGAVTISEVITPAKPVHGQGGTINVTVAGVGTGVPATGSLGYAFDGGATTVITLINGTAAIPIPTTLTLGNHSLALSYVGDVNYAAASAIVTLTISGKSQTTIASLTATTAEINVFGFGFTPPSGQLVFTDTTTGNPVVAPITLNTSTAVTSLLPEVTTSTGTDSFPVWTALGDVNGDGKLDLATSVYSTGSVTIQLGNGDGTFQAATSILIAPGFGPAENHLVSLRGNGTLDLVVASFNTNQIAVLLGNGDGTFQSPIFYSVGSVTNTPTSLTTGDFNHDGNLDVAVANSRDNTVSILLGNGSGALALPGAPISVGNDPEAIRAGDFNGDGYSDLAVANFNDGTVTTLLNNQNGTFIARTISVGGGAYSGPQALAINGSGSALLLAVANYRENTVSVLSSNGNGTFGTQTIIPVGQGPDDVNFADFNGDGIPDLAVSNYTSGTVNLVLGGSGGSYSVLGPFSVGIGPYSVAVGDVDLDGTPDILVSNCFSDNTGVLLSGTQISVPFSGLSLPAGHVLDATYNPDGASKYGSSTAPSVTAP